MRVIKSFGQRRSIVLVSFFLAALFLAFATTTTLYDHYVAPPTIGGPIVSSRIVAAAELSANFTKVKEDVESVKTEMKEDVESVKTEVKKDVESVKTEVKKDVESVKTEVESLKAELASIKALLVESSHQSQIDQSQITYYSSTWEKLWLDNIRNWQEHGICEAIAEQTTQVRAFMNGTCTARTDTPWCLIDDSVQQKWYHTEDGRVEKKRPSDIGRMSENAVEPVTDAAIWSYFEWTDPETGHLEREYIEPLVSHLRHPLAKCKHGRRTFLLDRSYVMPPSKRATHRKALLFDAGASDWSSGKGGPSLSYFAAVWQRWSIVWDHIEGWECTTPEAKFYDTVPNEWKAKTVYHQQCISTTPTEYPFVPTVIRQQADKEDYVLFKLDIDSKEVETAIVDHLLSGDNDDLSYIDEFVWEHHVDNYLMAVHWQSSQDMTKTIADSYDYFLRLRQKGVRAHSWV